MKHLLTITLFLAFSLVVLAPAQQEPRLHAAAATQLVSVKDGALVEYETLIQPEYYVLYHSASW